MVRSVTESAYIFTSTFESRVRSLLPAIYRTYPYEVDTEVFFYRLNYPFLCLSFLSLTASELELMELERSRLTSS